MVDNISLLNLDNVTPRPVCTLDDPQGKAWNTALEAEKQRQRQAAVDKVANEGSAADVVQALKGNNSSIGQLTYPEQTQLVERSVTRWDKDNNWKASVELARGVSGDPHLKSTAQRVFDKHPVHLVTYYANGASDKDQSFYKAAITRGREFHDNKAVFYVPVTTANDFKTAWQEIAASNRVVADVSHFGHGGVANGTVDTVHGGYGSANGQGKLFLAGSSLSPSEISSLPRLNYAPGASIALFACNTGVGKDPVAQSFVNSQGVPTTGQTGYTFFSRKPDEYAPFWHYFESSVGSVDPKDGKPLYLVPAMHDKRNTQGGNCTIYPMKPCDDSLLPKKEFRP